MSIDLVSKHLLSKSITFCGLIFLIAQSDPLFATQTSANSRNDAPTDGVHLNAPRNRTSAYLKSTTSTDLERRRVEDFDKDLDKNNPSKRTEEKDDQEFVDGDTRVPFWNIAHMINSIEQIDPALDAGANGIEVDISVDKKGVPVEAYHGFPCDCGRHCHYRENFIKFIQHLAKISTKPTGINRLLLVVFDLKLKDLKTDQKEVAGKQLARILDEHLYRKYLKEARSVRAPLRVVISINHVVDSVLIRSFMNHIRDNRLDFISRQVGFDVGMNDNLTDISDMWNNMPGLTFNIWQGDGLTNCANLIRGVDRLKEAISIRNEQGHFRKIYYWTADMMYQIRSILRFGLDAILTNQPQRVVQILEEPEFKVKYRLASQHDDPFTQFWIKPSAWKISPPSLSEAIETVTNIRETSENFIKNLPNGIAAAIQKVQHSISHTK